MVMRVLLGLRLLFDIVLCQSFIQHFTVLVKRVGFEEIVVVRLVVYLALLFHDIPWYMKGHRRTRALSPPSESFVCITAPRLYSILTRSTVRREQQSNALISLHCCSKQDLYL
ncbi:unnamed protein product [Gadus morhua 'NCC']